MKLGTPHTVVRRAYATQINKRVDAFHANLLSILEVSKGYVILGNFQDPKRVKLHHKYDVRFTRKLKLFLNVPVLFAEY